MNLPRDIDFSEVIKKLKKIGYMIDRQKGSHIRLKTEINGEHHITVPAPAHDPIKIGTLNNIILDVSEHMGISKKEMIYKLFD